MSTVEGRIAGHPDFELGVPRIIPVTYEAEIPDGAAAAGLVFVIPGFGGDRDEALLTIVRRHIAATNNLVAVSVRAHCFHNRLGSKSEGLEARLEINPWSIAKAIGALVPVSLKRTHAAVLSAHGHDVALEEMGEADLDGKFITTLEHGMGVSLARLFDRYYSTLTPGAGEDDTALGTRLVFAGGTKNYVVQHGADGPVAARVAWNS